MRAGIRPGNRRAMKAAHRRAVAPRGATSSAAKRRGSAIIAAVYSFTVNGRITSNRRR